jgi:hypothetical protein
MVAPVNAPRHVAEELGLEQRLGNRRAVHLDERHVALGRAVVDEARHHLLAGAGLAGDQHGALRLRHQSAPLQHVLHRLAAADDAVVVELGVALADQILLLRLEAMALHRAAGQRQQFVHLERLLEEVLDAHLEGVADDLRGAVRGHQHHLRPLAVAHRRGELAHELEARHALHHVVDDGEVEVPFGELAQRVAGVAGLGDVVPLRPAAPGRGA